MNTVTSLSSAGIYRSFPTTSQGNTSRSGGSVGGYGQGVQNSTSGQDTSSTDDSTDDTGSDTAVEFPPESTATNSQASADYRTLAKDLQADNVTAVQVDQQKLQTDLAITRPHHGGHHRVASLSTPSTPTARAAGSTLNVTV